MNFAQLAEARYSVRKFDTRKVEAEKVEAILRVGRIAPTACNNQPQRILVIDDAAGMAKLALCTSYTFGAPMAFLVCYDRSKSWVRSFDNDNSGEVDASIATTHMMLQAADLELGTTWVGYFDPVKVKKEFALPEAVVPVAILPLGYPAAAAKPASLHAKKLPPREVVFHGNFSAPQ